MAFGVELNCRRGANDCCWAEIHRRHVRDVGSLVPVPSSWKVSEILTRVFAFIVEVKVGLADAYIAKNNVSSSQGKLLV